MKKLLFVCLSLCIFSLLSVSCNLIVPEKKSSDNGAAIDWTDYTGSGAYSIRITNKTSVDLVVFKNSLSSANLIGGVKANVANHGLPANSSLFGSSSSDFTLVFLSNTEYEQNKNNLSSLEQHPFTRIYAMYNASSDNSVPFIVDSSLGGNNSLVLSNDTNYNMEICRDSPRGPAIGYAAAGSSNVTINLANGDYVFFPVFKTYDAGRDIVRTVYPKRPDSTPARRGASFEGGTRLSMNAEDFTANANFSSGYAYLVIRNESADGVQLMHNTVVQTTASGMRFVNPNNTKTFLIEMPVSGTGSNTTYAAKTLFSDWTLGELGSPQAIPLNEALFDDTVTGGEAATVFQSDHTYTITVTGNANTTGLVIGMPTERLSKPLGLSAVTAGDSSVQLSWSASTDANYYEVHMTNEDANAEYTYKTNTTALAYTVNDLEGGTVYWFKVRGVYGSPGNSDNEYSNFSDFASAQTNCSAPTEVEASGKSDNSVEISWNASKSAVKYTVYQALSASGDYTKIDETEDTSYIHTGLAYNDTYYYKISATGDDGIESGKSLYASASPSVISVTGISGLPSGMTIGTALSLNGTVEPENATNKTIVWSIKTAGGTGTVLNGSSLSASSQGTVTLLATITDGSGLGSNFVKEFTVTATPQFHAVTNITGVPASGTTGSTVTLSGTVEPADATNKTIAWSITSAGTTNAEITQTNRLNARAEGTVTVRATITNGLAAGTDYTKDFTISITLPPLTGTVAINGNAIVGQTLTANTTALGGSGVITYQWLRNGTTVIGTNTNSYTLVDADIGSTIVVRVTRDGYAGMVESAATATVQLPALTGSVSIIGNPIVGQTLTADVSSLGGTGTISYQWLRGGSSIYTEITGATNSTYTLIADDEGKTIKVRVSRAGYAGAVESAGIEIIAPPVVVAISVGYQHSLLLKSDGSVWATGENSYGALGKASSTIWIKVVDSDVISISAGNQRSFIIKKDGSLWATGRHPLGNGSGHSSFTKIIDHGVKDVSTSKESHKTIILKDDGSVWGIGTWSATYTGKFDMLDSTTFKKVFNSGAIHISNGSGYDIFIIKEDKSLWAAGLNSSGSLGTGDEVVRNSFVKVINNGVRYVTNALSKTYVIKEDGSLLYAGHAPDGSSIVNFTPSPVMHVTDVTFYTSIFYLKDDGSVWAKGDNNLGQLGVGDNLNRNDLVKVLDKNISTITTYNHSSFALTADGSLLATGNNDCGQLGTGDTVNLNTWTQVMP
ncbi:MAG: fibronectin type III domain-containing protein [Spirochaetaceae bacterium]|jgi:alpha-tubulin suppressor-like RCC1 family protein/fibronectin type 3 domain-containing protein|nr:fibronectin type III domain-containing protein [Spirochaetaceae bacterium]